MITDEDLTAMGYYETYEEYLERMRVKSMTPLEMVREFHKIMEQPLNQVFNDTSRRDKGGNDPLVALRYTLIEEEFEEFSHSDSEDLPNLLKELADMVYVIYGYAATFGWDLDEALRRVHLSNLSKLDPITGKPIRRYDGKVMKGEGYKAPDLEDLV